MENRNHRVYEAEAMMRALSDRTDLVMVGDTVMKEVGIPDIPECAHIDMGLSVRALSYPHPKVIEQLDIPIPGSKDIIRHPRAIEQMLDLIVTPHFPEPENQLRTLCIVKSRGKNE